MRSTVFRRRDGRSDKNHVIVSATKQDKTTTICELYSVPTVGGEPEFIMNYRLLLR